jgi:Ca2+-binding RTX toxin-like protein
VILRTTSSGGTERIVVGRPVDGPSGGRVVALADLPDSLRSNRCARGSGPKFAIIGTEGRDKISGTNKADRILSLGEKDKVSGANGNDCLDGADGGDKLSGSNGKDILLGDAGRDYLKGGADNDRIYGGDGGDRITGDFGRDTIKSGAGADFINVSVNGPAAKVRCGDGKDRVSINKNEMKRIKGCERVSVNGVRLR